jgi:hypothetical protein
MKKQLLFVLSIILLSSCIKNTESLQELKLLSIDEVSPPPFFTFNQVDTIKVKYTLPNSCHHFHSLYYQHQDTARIIAIRAVNYLERSCTEVIQQKELKIPILVSQKEDYLFKFWKGKDNRQEDIFEEIVINVK